MNEKYRTDDIIEIMVKEYINNFIGTTNNLDATNLINKSDVICIYGHSLGVTDIKWWRLILNWVLNTQFNRRLVVFYYIKNFDKRNACVSSSERRKIFNKLCEYSSKPDKSLLAERLVIQIINEESKLFNIKGKLVDKNAATTLEDIIE